MRDADGGTWFGCLAERFRDHHVDEREPQDTVDHVHQAADRGVDERSQLGRGLIVGARVRERFQLGLVPGSRSQAALTLNMPAGSRPTGAASAWITPGSPRI